MGKIIDALRSLTISFDMSFMRWGIDLELKPFDWTIIYSNNKEDLFDAREIILGPLQITILSCFYFKNVSRKFQKLVSNAAYNDNDEE